MILDAVQEAWVTREDEVILQLKQKPRTLLDRTVPIVLKLTYQPCNETECLLPQTLNIPLKFSR